ncbi:MAG: PAS-domain containing protein, partial [Pseudomonadota bacterium]
MKQPQTISTTRATRTELVMLLMASIACALVLTLGISQASPEGMRAPGLPHIALIGLVAGCGVLASVFVWRSIRSARHALEQAHLENAELHRQSAMIEAVVSAEPQTLLFWGQPSRLHVVNHSLVHVPGLPETEADLLRFADWLDGRSATNLKSALSSLLGQGTPFNMIIKTRVGAALEADGRAAGGRAVVRIRDIAGYKRDVSRIIDEHQNLARDISSSRALLNALPMPTWLMDDTGAIVWVNSAYVKAVEGNSEAEAIERQLQLLEQRQRASVSQSLAKGQPYNKRLSLIIDGEKRNHDVVVVGLKDGAAGAAIDVAALETAQGELDRQVAAFDRTLDRVTTAVSIYNQDRKLVFYNDAFRDLWDLEPAWLNTEPSDADVLDRLRANGRLPEVVNYPQWRQEFLREPDDGNERDDWWHIPGEQIVHVIVEQRPDGGVTHLYVDETERLALESRFNALGRVQSETIDSLKEGVVVFATDGRLKLYNSAFASIWGFEEVFLKDEPHIERLIVNIKGRYPSSRCWRDLKTTVTAISDQRSGAEGQETRDDHSVIDYATTPLPDGATLITFADVTASKRYERALVERNEALITGDRLKNQFIGHVSYELRTPLTNIIGFTELLGTPGIGDLNTKQREYLDDISFSSETLLAIIDDILDLATIDAGGLELEISEVDVRDLLERILSGIRERAVRAKLTLDIAIADDATTFKADESRIRQVLYNLLSNAVGFSKEGSSVMVTCWREAGDMVFQVQDQGVGISKE